MSAMDQPTDDARANAASLLTGDPVPAPDWFARALAVEPERVSIAVDGAAIETLAWGRRGDPGLLLLHGNAAHADWWSFIAPALASGHRVVAPSWSGMGGSDSRTRYGIDLHVAELFAAADASGLLDGPVKPVVVGHSLGALIAVAAAHSRPDAFAALVLVDPPIFAPATLAERLKRWGSAGQGQHRVYRTLEDVLRQFRFTPRQPCANLFVADYIARRSVTRVAADAGEGWTWRFDRRHLNLQDHGATAASLATVPCPVAVVLGDRSTLRNEADLAHMRGLYPPGTIEVGVPDADHHVWVDQPLAFIAAIRALLAGGLATRGRRPGQGPESLP